MARLLEHDSLELLGRYGVPVPAYEVAGDPDEAAAALERLGGRAVLKALVPVGGRGKAGAVARVSGPEEARAEAARILGSVVRRFPVDRLLVMEALEIRREFFLSITFDPAHRGPLVLFSAEGGIEIEELAAERPEAILELPVDITRGLGVYQGLDLAERAGLDGPAALQAGEAMAALYTLFRAADCRMVEINPLAEVEGGRILAASGVVNLDEQALFRHPGLAERASAAEGNGWRPLTPLEEEMREIDAIDPHVGAIRFAEMDGDIGFMVTGGGYSLTSLAQLIEEGGRPACTFDITPGRYEEKMYRAVRAVLSIPRLKGLLIAGNVSNFTRVDIKAAGVARALKEAGRDYGEFPVVIRFAGPGVEEARRLIAEVPGVDWHEEGFSLEDAARRIVERAYGRAKGEAGGGEDEGEGA
ncbi:MAG: ATP-grasp domain-containing protein [bacterium]